MAGSQVGARKEGLEAQLSHQAVATALLVALVCLLVHSFDRGHPA